ncbi:MAG TPA: ParB N-terminal domain-containing protein [Pirellulales bacterium]|nr:ParB N-terminal domain-containing protein [Pirellulales bacterium]
MKFHPLANVFPLMSDGEIKELAADIEAHGQREPIYVFEGQILDGRNRFKACKMAKRQPSFEPWEGNDPVAFVVSMNLRRRHLNESQRAIVAAKLASLEHGKHPSRRGESIDKTLENMAKNELPIGNSPSSGEPRVSIPQAAELLNVGRRSVSRAREILQHGDQALVDAVEAGEVSVTDAANVVDKPKPIQQAALDAVRAGKAKTLVKAAERLEPKEESEGTSAIGPRTDRQLEREATVVVRRIELEYNRERIRGLRWRVRNLDPSCGPSYFREQFKELLTLINDLDSFVTRQLDVKPEAFP